MSELYATKSDPYRKLTAQLLYVLFMDIKSQAVPAAWVEKIFTAIKAANNNLGSHKQITEFADLNYRDFDKFLHS